MDTHSVLFYAPSPLRHWAYTNCLLFCVHFKTLSVWLVNFPKQRNSQQPSRKAVRISTKQLPITRPTLEASTGPPPWSRFFPPEPTETLGTYEFLLSSLTGPHLLSFSVSSRLQRRADHLPPGGVSTSVRLQKNDWYPKIVDPRQFLLLIIGFSTPLSVLGNHCRVMMYYIAWKTSLSVLCKSDSITSSFSLDEQNSVIEGREGGNHRVHRVLSSSAEQ